MQILNSLKYFNQHYIKSVQPLRFCSKNEQNKISENPKNKIFGIPKPENNNSDFDKFIQKTFL